MKAETLNLITISYAKRALLTDSRERKRMLDYGKHLKSFHVVVFTGAKEDYPKYSKEDNVHFYATSSKSGLGKIIDAYKISKRIINSLENEEVVVTSQDPFEAGLVGRLATHGTIARHHVQIHADIFSLAWRQEALSNRWRVLLAKIILANTGSIRVVSERIKKSLVKLGISENKITVLPIKANLNEFLKVGDNRDYKTTDKVRVLYVGRFSIEKNLPVLLEATRLLKEQVIDFELQLMGDGVLKNKCVELVKNKGITDQVRFLPWSDDVPQVMAEADVLVLASGHEGWGMVLLEAMATGLPIVTTDVGCVGELLRDGEECLVVKELSAKNFARAMRKLITDNAAREKIGQTGFLTARNFNSSSENYYETWRSTYN